jgi:hypothetical protein
MTGHARANSNPAPAIWAQEGQCFAKVQGQIAWDYQGLTAEKMNDCRWLRPSLVALFEFLERTPDNHLS